jgi:hypothetical protein
MSRGISSSPEPDPTALPASIDSDTIFVSAEAVDPYEKAAAASDSATTRAYPPRGRVIKDKETVDFDSVVIFPILPPPGERKKKTAGTERRWLPESKREAEMLFTSSVDTPEMSWIIRRSRAMIKEGKNGSSMQVGAGAVKKKRVRGLPRAGSKRVKRTYNWKNPFKNKAWKVLGKGFPKVEVVTKEKKGKGKEKMEMEVDESAE